MAYALKFGKRIDPGSVSIRKTDLPISLYEDLIRSGLVKIVRVKIVEVKRV
jgi:hypothetical protein